MPEPSSKPELSVVVPVYKEEAGIRPFLSRTEQALSVLGVSYEIIFCLDPSPDRTEAVIQEDIQRNPRIKMIVFSRRFGQPPATMAGILLCAGKFCVVIDVDLQDPPELISALYRKACEGFEVVYAKRRSRKGETFIKRCVADWGYRLINKIAEVPIPRDTGDFRILSRRVIEELKQWSEAHGFLRGLVAYVGFKQACIEYDRESRQSGRGNYNPFTGSIRIALNGLVGYSFFPLQLAWLSGLVIMAAGAGMTMVHFYRQVAGAAPLISGTVCAMVFLSGIQLFFFGVLGEYVGRIYQEVRRRPLFIIDRKINL